MGWDVVLLALLHVMCKIGNVDTSAGSLSKELLGICRSYPRYAPCFR